MTVATPIHELRKRTLIAVALAMLFVIACFSEICFPLCFGWVNFVARTFPKVHVRWDATALFLGLLIVAIAGVHSFLRWFISEINVHRSAQVAIRWSFRASVCGTLLVLMIFVVGMAMVGVIHQCGWLLTAPEAIHVSKQQTHADSDLSVYRPGVVEIDARQSWLLQILPFIGVVPETYQNLEKAWNAPENAAPFRRLVPDAICPTQGYPHQSPDGFGLSHIAWNDRIAASSRPLRLTELELKSETILLGEVNAGLVPWACVHPSHHLEEGIQRDWSSATRGHVGCGSMHGGGANCCMVDGSIRFLSNNIDRTVLEQLCRPKVPEKDQP